MYLGHMANKHKVELHGKISDKVLKRKFFEFDKDGSDTLDFDEFLELIKRLGLNVEAEQAENLFMSADKACGDAMTLEGKFSWTLYES